MYRKRSSEDVVMKSFHSSFSTASSKGLIDLNNLGRKSLNPDNTRINNSFFGMSDLKSEDKGNFPTMKYNRSKNKDLICKSTVNNSISIASNKNNNSANTNTNTKSKVVREIESYSKILKDNYGQSHINRPIVNFNH